MIKHLSKRFISSLLLYLTNSIRNALNQFRLLDIFFLLQLNVLACIVQEKPSFVKAYNGEVFAIFTEAGPMQITGSYIQRLACDRIIVAFNNRDSVI